MVYHIVISIVAVVEVSVLYHLLPLKVSFLVFILSSD